MKNSGYEILQFSMCEGWVNNLFDGNENVHVFATLGEAVKELQEEFDDWQVEIENGSRGKDEAYDIESFQVIDNQTGIIYELDIINHRIVIANSKTCN